MYSINRGGNLLKVAALGIAGYFLYTILIKNRQPYAKDSATELKRLAEQNIKRGNNQPSAAHLAVANQIFENFNNAVVTNSNEDRIVSLMRGTGNAQRSITEMAMIYQAYGVRDLPNRIDFDIFSVGFSKGSLIQHVERIFDHDRPQTAEFISVLNTVLNAS